MRVGLNLIFLVPGETGGMEVVARELIPELLRGAPGIDFTAFINREAAATGDGPWGSELPAVVVPVNARSRPQWVLGEQFHLPRLARREGVDLVHSLASTSPTWGPFKRVVTVHDLIYARFPEAHAGLRDLGMRVLVPLGVRRAQRVTADSQSTQRDLIELAHADPGRIDVVPLGLGTPPRRGAIAGSQSDGRQELGERQALGERLGLGERQVVLSLSAKRPHKNLAVLIAALARIPAERRPLLILPGYPTAHEATLRELAAAKGVAEDVRFLAWISQEDLEDLWGLAQVFAYPSLYEGFGLPVLEAMARGVPVVCSDASSLPEVAGDAALLFEPHDEASLAAALERLLAEPRLREELRQRGIERAAQFTWQRTAQLTLQSYARALGMAEVPSAWVAP